MSTSAAAQPAAIEDRVIGGAFSDKLTVYWSELAAAQVGDSWPAEARGELSSESVVYTVVYRTDSAVIVLEERHERTQHQDRTEEHDSSCLHLFALRGTTATARLGPSAAQACLRRD
jgi:hypothetical protein